jgi:hypothetical protein
VLDLRGNEITSIGARDIADALEHNSTVYEVDLSENLIGHDGMRALAKALADNHAVTACRVTNQATDFVSSAVDRIGLYCARNMMEREKFLEGARRGHFRVVKEEIQLGVSPLSTHMSDLNTAAHIAAAGGTRGHAMVLQSLARDSRFGPMSRRRNHAGKTPFDLVQEFRGRWAPNRLALAVRDLLDSNARIKRRACLVFCWCMMRRYPSTYRRRIPLGLLPVEVVRILCDQSPILDVDW